MKKYSLVLLKALGIFFLLSSVSGCGKKFFQGFKRRYKNPNDSPLIAKKNDYRTLSSGKFSKKPVKNL